MKHKPLLARLAVAAITLAGNLAYAAPQSGVPALRVTAPNGESSILIGSAHTAVKGMLEPDASSFADATTFVTEHASDPQPGDEGSAGTLAPWAQGLSNEEVMAYARRAECAQVSPDVAIALLLRPSPQVANQLAYTACGWTGIKSRDDVVAREMPATVVRKYLEDDAAVEARRRSLPLQVTYPGFRWALDHDPATVMTEVGAALDRGDYEALRAIVDASVGDPDAAKIFDRVMVDERNASWMPRLRGYLNNGHAVILVGAMHLPGENGLIHKLAQDGYRVKPITLPARAD